MHAPCWRGNVIATMPVHNQGGAVEDYDFEGLDEEIAGDIITIVGSAFHQPIADLLERLAARKPTPSNDFMAGNFQNGYCASIVILLVLAFESYVSRMTYHRTKGAAESRKTAPRSTPDYLKHIDPTFPFAEELQDIYILRDGLAHGHLWSVDYVLNAGGSHVKKRELFEGFGDVKMRSRVDLTTGKTRHLGLNVLPTSVGLKEAAVAFRIIAESLHYLINAGFIEQAAVRSAVRYGGKNTQFWSLHAVLAELVSSSNAVSKNQL